VIKVAERQRRGALHYHCLIHLRSPARVHDKHAARYAELVGRAIALHRVKPCGCGFAHDESHARAGGITYVDAGDPRSLAELLA
jgi:hypothetical protein